MGLWIEICTGSDTNKKLIRIFFHRYLLSIVIGIRQGLRRNVTKESMILREGDAWRDRADVAVWCSRRHAQYVLYAASRPPPYNRLPYLCRQHENNRTTPGLAKQRHCTLLQTQLPYIVCTLHAYQNNSTDIEFNKKISISLYFQLTNKNHHHIRHSR